MVEFAQLATVFAKEVLGIASPRVGLLNNGGEESKGNLLTRESYQLLKKTSLNFIGNIEGMKLLKGSVDVVVTDGFTGNIVIKTLEGVGDTFHDLLGEGQAIEVNRSLTGRGLVHYMDLISAAREVDYQAVGGASLLGVDGNVVLAHGHSNAEAIKSAIYLAHRAAQSKIVEAIKNGYGVSSNAICDYA